MTRASRRHGAPATPDRAGRIADADQPWWRSAVFYQIYPRSFADGDGDGVGDLVGVAERLDYLTQLGVDALWLSPFYRSPMADGGYDVSDHTDVDPVFGTLADFDVLLSGAHARGIRVCVDLVPNHVSDQHRWFVAALAAPVGSAERARFLFRDGRGPDGSEPPNNWPSIFGGPAWTRVADGQWYLHLFAPEQPDLDWTNPEVAAELERVARFWLDRGVDGFRIDVVHGMAKPEGLPDMDLTTRDERFVDDIRFDRDHVHDYVRALRSLLDSYPGDRMAIGEAWVATDERLAQYVRPDELNLAFNFSLVLAGWGADLYRAAIESSLASMASVGATCTWVLSNHDVIRHVSRYGDGLLGFDRGRAAALVQLALPGAAFLYNGDELGLPNVELPDSALQDPTWERSGHAIRGRDGGRVPLPWEGDGPTLGFSSGDASWLPMPPDWAQLTVEAQLEDVDSTLSLYRRALEIRSASLDLLHAPLEWVGAPDGCLAFRRGPSFVCTLNTNEQPVPIPSGQILLASAPLHNRLLPPDATAWILT